MGPYFCLMTVIDRSFAEGAVDGTLNAAIIAQESDMLTPESSQASSDASFIINVAKKQRI